MIARAGAAQFQGSRDWRDNVAAVERLSELAARNGVNLLCFHELASTIYPPFAEDPRLFELAEPEDGPSVSAACEAARRNELLLVYPFFEREGERYYNSAMIFGPKGERLAKYRKTTVPTSRLLPGANERWFFSQGDLGFPVVDTPFGLRVGIIICYDRNIPEPARCSALNGAELLMVPATTVTLVRPWWELLLRARAVENVMYVVATNRVGEDRGGAPGVQYFGESLIIDPKGDVVAHASDTAEDLVWADVDVELLRGQREKWSFFSDRQPGAYGVLTKG